MKATFLLLWLLGTAASILSTPPRYEPLPSLRDQNLIQQGWVQDRRNRIIPLLMAQNKVEMWIVSMREYNEDQVFWALVPRATAFAARRRTMFVFFKRDSEFRTWTFVDNTDALWTNLVNVLYEVDPASIAVNIDASGNNFADGLHAGEAEKLLKNLPFTYWLRVTRAPLLSTQFLATRAEGMLPHYRKLMRIAHAIIREGFSLDAITPGKTTAEDLQWFFRDRIQSLNMTTWFHPNVDIQRYLEKENKVVTLSGSNAVIEKGDFLWTDFGVSFMGLNTDTQHNAYVLRDGEADAPEGLRKGLTEHSNVMQDILMREIHPNITGNQVLQMTLSEMQRLHINGSVYCHPIGDFGHSAGSLIGMTNLQDGVPVLGDLPIFPHMWYSIELQANVRVAEWGGDVVNFRQEEDAYLDRDGFAQWVDGRQSRLHLVGEARFDVAVSGSQTGFLSGGNGVGGEENLVWNQVEL